MVVGDPGICQGGGCANWRVVRGCCLDRLPDTNTPWQSARTCRKPLVRPLADHAPVYATEVQRSAVLPRDNPCYLSVLLANADDERMRGLLNR